MPKTLDNHLIGVTADRPHPESERPDLPLRSELFGEDPTEAARDEGFAAGRAAAEFDAELEAEAEATAHDTVVAALTAQLAASREEVASLRQQLEAKKSA